MAKNPEFAKLIDGERDVQGFKPEDVAHWLGKRSKSYYYRITTGPQEPSVEQINRLAAELKISVETILLSLGAKFNPPAAMTLPFELVDSALQLEPTRRLQLIESAHGLLLRQQQSKGQKT